MAKKQKFTKVTKYAIIIAIIVVVFSMYFATSGQTAKFYMPRYAPPVQQAPAQKLNCAQTPMSVPIYGMDVYNDTSGLEVPQGTTTAYRINYGISAMNCASYNFKIALNSCNNPAQTLNTLGNQLLPPDNKCYVKDAQWFFSPRDDGWQSICACIDKNNDKDYNDANEQACTGRFCIGNDSRKCPQNLASGTSP